MNENETNVTICNLAILRIKECRQTNSSYRQSDGFEEKSQKTETSFHWKMKTISPKIKLDDLTDDNKKEQEVIDAVFSSTGYELDAYHLGFKTREEAIKNALKFAQRNGITVDGYTL